MSGWIKLHRKLLKWEWYKDVNTCRMFLHILLNVSHEPFTYKGKKYTEGQFVTTLNELATNTCLSIQQTRTALSNIRSTHEITYESSKQNTVITVNNWINYQQSNTQNNTRSTYNQHTIQHTNNIQITHDNTLFQTGQNSITEKLNVQSEKPENPCGSKQRNKEEKKKENISNDINLEPITVITANKPAVTDTNESKDVIALNAFFAGLLKSIKAPVPSNYAFMWSKRANEVLAQTTLDEIKTALSWCFAPGEFKPTVYESFNNKVYPNYSKALTAYNTFISKNKPLPTRGCTPVKEVLKDLPQLKDCAKPDLSGLIADMARKGNLAEAEQFATMKRAKQITIKCSCGCEYQVFEMLKEYTKCPGCTKEYIDKKVTF